MNITEKDAEVLDYIVIESLKRVCLRADDLKPLDNGFLSNSKEVKESAYTYYFDILKEKNVVSVKPGMNNRIEIYSIDIKTRRFVEQGGFKAMLENERQNTIKRQEDERLAHEKLQIETRLSKLKLKTFWPLFAFAFISFAYNIYSFTKDRNNGESINKLEQSNQRMESELSKLHTLLLDQKSLHSLQPNKIRIDSLDKK